VERRNSLRPSSYVLRPLITWLGCLVAARSWAQATYTQSTDPYETRFRQKSNFQVRFHAPEKGGEIRLYTKNPVQFEKDQFWEGSGDVVIEYQDVKITADHARYVFPTDVATLEGHVVIDQGPTRMSGDKAVFKLKAKTGRMENAVADLAPTYHIVAQSIEKIGEATYRVEKGIFTACDIPRPAWSFRLSEAVITLDDYARMKDVSFRAFRSAVPLLYTPYLIWPTKEDRATGFLVPGIGASGGRGLYLGLSHFWVTSRSTDLTSSLDTYSKGSVGVGEEFRWTPTPESAGIFQGYAIHDTDATVCVPASEEPSGGDGPCLLPDGTLGVFTHRTKNRWKFRLDHVSDDLPWGMRGVVDIRDYSDNQYLQDLERSFALNSSSQILSRAFLSKNSGNDSFNLRFERSETFYATDVLQERLPSLEYIRRTDRIGETPLFFAAEGSASYLFVNRGENLPHGTYGRLDLHPTLSLPWKRIPWLSITASLGGRLTEYSDSVNDAQTEFVGSSFTRSSVEAGLSIVGPSFSRIYDGDLFGFAKFKHVIEPRIDYTYVSNVTDPQRIPAYDEVDTQLGENQIRYALVNRLLARPEDPKQGAAREIASLEISQTYSFELPQTVVLPGTIYEPLITKEGPVTAELRLSPGTFFQFDGRIDYDTKSSQMTDSSITTGVTWKGNFVNFVYFASRPVLATPLPPGVPSPNSDQFRLAAGLDLSKAFRIDTQVNYDAQQNLVQEDRSLLTFKGSCYTIFLEVHQLRLPPSPRRDIRLVFNLKDIGTLLDFHQSMDRLFGQ
jgi:LPS-assembly protein